MVSRILPLLMRCFGEFKREGGRCFRGLCHVEKGKQGRQPIFHSQESFAKGTKISLDAGFITFHGEDKSGLQ